MPTEFKLPELGENVDAGDVLRVLVSVGDTVALEQPVLELETDKATIEVPSSVAGRVTAVNVSQGDRVGVGQTVLTLETDGAEQPAGGKDSGQAAGKAPEAQPEAPGKPPTPEAAPPEPEASTPAAEPAAEEEEEAEAPPARQFRGEVVDIKRAKPAPARTEPSGPAAPAAPSVRRRARELGIDIHDVPGTGAKGRISVEDVVSYAKQIIVGRSAPGAPSAAPPLPDFSRWGAVEREPMRGVRRKTAQHLTTSWTTIPHVTQCDVADATDLEALRKRYAPRAEAAGGKLTVTAIALKVVASALKVFPEFNTSVDIEREEIVRKSYVHVGVAVDTPHGLLVPVIRDVDRKNIVELAVELAAMSDKARGRKLSLEEMEGGSITITNLGGIGGTYFTPIINHPEVAILGISRARMEPVYRDGELVPRLMLPLSLSYDHRVIDGANAIRFLRWVVEALEQPFVLSLDG